MGRGKKFLRESCGAEGCSCRSVGETSKRGMRKRMVEDVERLVRLGGKLEVGGVPLV
jgi:hypothetical protein